MRLSAYCRSENGFLLLPIEHLGPGGPGADAAASLRDESGWSTERIELLSAGLRSYFERGRAIAAQTRIWPKPRVRNLGIALERTALRPYAQVLNTSTWNLFDADVDPATSSPALLAYLLVLGDWMAMTGEVTQVSLRSAAWWLTSDDAERRDFARGAASTTRPDAPALSAVADALPWLMELRHDDLRPAGAMKVRPVPGTGLSVPVEHERAPMALIESARKAAVATVGAFRSAWSGDASKPVGDLLARLRSERLRVIVTGESGVVWDPDRAEDTGALEHALAGADPVAVEAIAEDLALIDGHTKRFLAAVAAPDALEPHETEMAESGYAYMYPGRPLVAYNLSESGMERLSGPPLPYERAMLGARVLHEWAHLADDAGLIALRRAEQAQSSAVSALAAALDEAVEACALARRSAAQSDLDALCAGRRPGEALAETLLARLPDYRANLLFRAFATGAERMTYARHNVRTLRHEYNASTMWRMVVRYLYEYQYLLPALGLIELDDPYRYFSESTGFADDIVANAVLSEERFHDISRLVSEVCGGFAVDESAIALPG